MYILYVSTPHHKYFRPRPGLTPRCCSITTTTFGTYIPGKTKHFLSARISTSFQTNLCTSFCIRNPSKDTRIYELKVNVTPRHSALADGRQREVSRPPFSLTEPERLRLSCHHDSYQHHDSSNLCIEEHHMRQPPRNQVLVANLSAFLQVEKACEY